MVSALLAAIGFMMVGAVLGVIAFVYGLRYERKRLGSVMARFADLDAMIAALPAVLREELSAREQDAEDREERSAQDRKNGVDITEDVMNMLRYSVEDAFGALRGNGGDGE